MTQRESWTTTIMSEVGEEINDEELTPIVCETCEEPATSDTIRGYIYCRQCPEDTDERVYYCGECLFLCNRRHRRRDHEPQLQHLSITNVQSLTSHSSKLLVKYNEYSIQKETDLISKRTNIMTKSYDLTAKLFQYGIQGFIQYQAVFVAAGSKAAIKATKEMGMSMTNQVLRHSLGGAAGIQAIYCAVEIGIACALWYDGKIDGKELVRRCGKSVVGNTAAFAGGYLGFKVGAVIGTWFGPGIGTLVGGIIGAVVGSLTAQFVTETTFEKFFPEAKKLDPKKELKSALSWFHLEEKDMKDPNKWNERHITKLYRQLAKVHHPDRLRGEEGKFIATTKHFGILLAELDSKNKGDGNKSKQRRREITP